MTVELVQAKLEALAEIVDGRIVPDDPGVAFSVKGSVLGFPAAIKGIHTKWPFGVMYFIETRVIEDPTRPSYVEPLKLTISPRFGRGLFRFFAHILLFEARGMPVGDKNLEARFVFSYNERALAERFVKYPGMADRLARLEDYSKFTELVVKSDAGLFLSQPQSLSALDLDVCRETLRLLGEIGQVLFEAF